MNRLEVISLRYVTVNKMKNTAIVLQSNPKGQRTGCQRFASKVAQPLQLIQIPNRCGNRSSCCKTTGYSSEIQHLAMSVVREAMANRSVVHPHDCGIVGIAKDARPIRGVNTCISRVTAVRP